MKKFLIFTIALAVLIALPYSPVFPQAPQTLMVGSLMTNDGSKDFGIWAGASVKIIENEQAGVKSSLRTGYFYVNSSPNEIQSFSILNVLEKNIKSLSQTTTLYVATGGGFLIEIEDEEDMINGAFLLEVGAQFGKTIKLALGGHYEPIQGASNRTFVYLLVNLFPN